MATTAIGMLQTWGPVALGMVHAGFNVKYADDFPQEDLVNGEWNGDTGHFMMGMSGAVIAVMGLAVIAWLMWMFKMRSGEIKGKGKDSPYTIGMGRLWYILLAFYALSLSLAAMDVCIIRDFDGEKAKVNDDNLEGDIGGKVHGMGVAVLATGGVAVLYHMYLYFGLREKKNKYEFLEVHSV